MQEVFKAGKIKRADVFVATKLWNNNHRPERVKPAFEASLKKLQLDYADLYLIHTPFAFRPGDEQDPRDASGNVIYDKGVTLLDTWRAMEGLVDEGRCKAISTDKVNEIFEAARITPWHRAPSVRGTGPWWRAEVAGRSSDHRHRQASHEERGPGPTRLGHPTRDGPFDHFDDPQSDQGEL